MLLQIWDCEEVHDPMDVSVSSSLARVVEQIISQYQWFFQNDAQMPSWDHQLPVCLSLVTSSSGDTNHLALPALAANMSHSSPVPSTR